MKNKGIYNKGHVKRTKRQRKKHVSQMSNEELKYLSLALKGLLPYITFTRHFVLNKVVCSKKDVVAILEKDNLEELIIEYNETIRGDKVDKRVLVRDNESKEVIFYKDNSNSFKEYGHLCVVVSVLSGEIITAYWNLTGDNHDTLDWGRYDKDLKIGFKGDKND